MNMSEEVQFLHATPEVLTWARREWGLSINEVSRRTGIPFHTLEEAEHGIQRLTVAQGRRLAEAYRRALAVFLLPQPPEPCEPDELDIMPGDRVEVRLEGGGVVVTTAAVRLRVERPR